MDKLKAKIALWFVKFGIMIYESEPAYVYSDSDIEILTKLLVCDDGGGAYLSEFYNNKESTPYFLIDKKPKLEPPGIVVKQVGDTFEIKVTNMNASQIVSVVRELEKCALDLMKRDAGMQK